MTDLITKDISTEQWREYDYLDGTVYRIEKPKLLIIRPGGSGHRIVDVNGVAHWVPTDVFFCLRWYSPEEPVSF